MKNAVKMASVLTAFVLAVSLGACGAKQNQTADQSKPNIQEAARRTAAQEVRKIRQRAAAKGVPEQ